MSAEHHIDDPLLERLPRILKRWLPNRRMRRRPDSTSTSP